MVVFMTGVTKTRKSAFALDPALQSQLDRLAQDWVISTVAELQAVRMARQNVPRPSAERTTT